MFDNIDIGLIFSYIEAKLFQPALCVQERTSKNV